MSNQSTLSRVVDTGVWHVFILAAFVAGTPAMAQNSNDNYVFLVASGFLCEPGDSFACPAVVKSAEDESYEMSGAGTLNAQSRAVMAVGTFTHKSSSANAIETGIWIASELVSFNSYGAVPGALPRERWAFGPQQFGPKRLPMLSGSVPAGGLAVFRIRLLPTWGASRTATLQVNCAIGSVPSEHRTEGIRLSFEGGIEFDEEVSGRTLFVLTGARASVVPKPPIPESAISTAPAEVKH